jgi:ammonium transporter Rh
MSANPQPAVELQQINEEKKGDKKSNISATIVLAGCAQEIGEGDVAVLLSACAKNNSQKILSILRGGVNPDVADYDHRSSLHLSASEGHLDVVRILIEEGANPNVKDRFNSTPLDDALRNGHAAVVSYLKSIGAKFNMLQAHELELVQACADHKVDKVRELLKNGVDPNCGDYDRRTPLHLAVAEGSLDICNVLLEYKANPLAEDRWGATPLYEARRRTARTGDDPIADLFSQFDKKEHPSMCSAFASFLVVWQIIMIILFGIFVRYGDNAAGPVVADPAGGANASLIANADIGAAAQAEIGARYPFFQDVHVMIFIGFGYLMTFLRKNAYNSLGLTFLVGAFVIQWYTLCNAFWLYIFHPEGNTMHNIGMLELIKADFCVGAVLITYGGILGKVTPFQLMIIGLFETILFSLNEEIALKLGVADLGGSMVIHQFGAFFGLAITMVVSPASSKGNPQNAAIYHSDTFAMIGTIFLWMFWPSFNGALGSENQQQRAIINTYFGLTASCLAAFAASHMFRHEQKFCMVDVQNATLAGGVAMGTVCDQLIYPASALTIGFLAGFVSVIGYVYVQPFLERKLGLHDTCGINNLHGMPSLIGGFAGVISASQAKAFDGEDGINNNYGDSISTVWVGTSAAGDNNSASKMANVQLAMMVITMVIAVGGGFIIGFIARFPIFGKRDADQFSDQPDWEVPELELPYFFDKRGEVPRDAAIQAAKKQEEQAKLHAKKDDITALESRLNILETKLNRVSGAGTNSGRLEGLFAQFLGKLETKLH